ncbi:hypothetical protein C8039_19305 [Halogeometricum sp. wsp3]|nr:hypothetical protein C8039_19305 [Halogeometricum sp. wsp3]
MARSARNLRNDVLTDRREHHRDHDTDADGLSDEMEREGVILGGPNGDRVTTDPKSADTDGDGLSDSREIGQYTDVNV